MFRPRALPETARRCRVGERPNVGQPEVTAQQARTTQARLLKGDPESPHLLGRRRPKLDLAHRESTLCVALDRGLLDARDVEIRSSRVRRRGLIHAGSQRLSVGCPE